MKDANISSLPRFEEIECEAALWAVRLDQEDAPASLLAEFEQWRRQSPQHQDAAERLADFWDGMAGLDAFNDLAETQAVAAPKQAGAAKRLRLSPRAAFGLAACVAAFAGLGVYPLLLADPPFDGAYETVRGEQQTIELPDSSRVVLNTDSALEAEFTNNARIIRLTRGEAYFDVEKDPSKPFSVETEQGTVTAVGTAFSVRVSDNDMNVLVSEGRVALRMAQSNRVGRDISLRDLTSATVEVDAGERALVEDAVKTVAAIPQQEIDRSLDWQDGMLEFQGAPLRDVVADISRYTDIKIEIADAQLAERRVVAYYRIGEIEPMFEALKLTANVEVERLGENRVRLSLVP